MSIICDDINDTGTAHKVTVHFQVTFPDTKPFQHPSPAQIPARGGSLCCLHYGCTYFLRSLVSMEVMR